MEITITPEEMKALEADYIEKTGVPGILLMEQAAQGLVRALREMLPGGGRVLVLCGPGGNGGDGYAAARLWTACGGSACIRELTDRPRGDAAVNRTLAVQLGIPCEVQDENAPLPECDLILDALYGTGLTRPPEGAALALIEAANRSGRPILAADIPSGLEGSAGAAPGAVIRADRTVTFHRIKRGLLLGRGPDCAGEITVQPIHIPAGWGNVDGLRCLTPDDLPAVLPPRPADCHKGSFGRTLILAGSPGMAGAAALCAAAAVKAGSGLTTILTPAPVLPVVQTLTPAAMAKALPMQDGRIAPEALQVLEEALQKADRVAVGCGLGLDASLSPLLSRLQSAPLPVIWDADALTFLSEHPARLPASHVLTPHPGEAARLLHVTPAEVTARPRASLHRLQGLFGCRVMLKGARSLMTDGLHTAVNRFTSPCLAKGGSGDILCGILAALTGRVQGEDVPLLEMQTAALLHGLAARRATAENGEDCVTPADLIRHIRFR